MMKDIERGQITGLIFSKLARLARNTRELLDFAEYFDLHGADLARIAHGPGCYCGCMLVVEGEFRFQW
jgi:DNA invertase Pin-like site-specific DNA recombinase